MLTEQQEKESLNIQSNAEQESSNKEDSSNEIIERVAIKDSEFEAVRLVNGECFGVFGRYRITDVKDNMPDVIDELEKISWTMIVRIIAVLIEGAVKWEMDEYKRGKEK